MTNTYNDGKWHGWNGGECPVHPESKVDVLFADGSGSGLLCFAGDWNWGVGTHPVAFRVVKEYKKPREWWILHGKIYGYNCDPSAVHVREVLD